MSKFSIIRRQILILLLIAIVMASTTACASRQIELQEPPTQHNSNSNDTTDAESTTTTDPISDHQTNKDSQGTEDKNTSSSNINAKENDEVSDEIKKLLPIEDEFIALDLVKDSLKLDNFEQVPNGSGGYTYEKDIYGLVGSGHAIYKETGERIFLVDYLEYDPEYLAEGFHACSNPETYAVFRDTGLIRRVTMDEVK